MARRARSLQTLLDQLNARFPGRSTASDGWIGDDAHKARGSHVVSQHNAMPVAGEDIVCALDITQDLAVGLDCGQLMEELDASNDPRIFYLIHDRKIDNSDDSRTPYRGANGHVGFLHFSVRYQDRGLYDDARAWNLPMLGGSAPAEPRPTTPVGARLLQLTQPPMRGNDVAALQNRLRNDYPAYRHDVAVQRGQLITVDATFGAQTDAWVRELQRRSRLKVDGVVGPATRKALQL